jgi:hypothetical protein
MHSPVLGIRIRSDPNLFVGSGSGNFDRIRIRPPYRCFLHPSEKVIFSHQHFQDFSFSANSEKNFRPFSQNYLKQRHFELFTKSGMGSCR